MMTNSKNKNKWIAGLFCCTLLVAPCIVSSCSEDEGNYDYHEIPEVTVNGIEASYTVMRGTGYVLEIKPEVTTTGNPNDLEYLWMMQTTTNPELNKTYVLGRERDLTWNIDEIPPLSMENASTIVYRVTDKTSGVTVTKSAVISSTSRLGSGIMLMTENTEGNGVLQFISMATDTMVVYNAFTEESGFALPLGKPVNIITLGRGQILPPASYWISTEDDAWRFDANFQMVEGSAFSDNTLLTDENYERGKNIVVDAFPHRRRVGEAAMNINSMNSVFFCSNGLLFVGSTSFVDPVNIVRGESDISLASPYIFFPFSFSTFSYFMFYDYVHERFLQVSLGSGLTLIPQTSKPADAVGDIFPWDQSSVNRTLVFGQPTTNTDGGSTNGNCFALMRDKTTNDFFIYKFYKFLTLNNKRDFYSIGKVATDLDKASFYAFSPKRTALYYTVGSKLYGLDYNKGNEKVYLIKDFGEEITYMRLDDQIEPTSGYIYVATYSSSNGGTFMKMEEGTNPDKLELTTVPDSKWTGLNKIVGYSWK